MVYRNHCCPYLRITHYKTYGRFVCGVHQLTNVEKLQGIPDGDRAIIICANTFDKCDYFLRMVSHNESNDGIL
jgi:hypothetical protein